MKLQLWSPASTYTPSFDPFRGFLADVFGAQNGEGRCFAPAIDIVQTADAYVLSAELPGMSREDVSVEVEDGVLVLSGTKKLEKSDDKINLYRGERCFGSFSRSWTLPADVKSDAINASFKDGVLTLTMPRAEAAKPQRIAIQ